MLRIQVKTGTGKEKNEKSEKKQREKINRH